MLKRFSSIHNNLHYIKERKKKEGKMKRKYLNKSTRNISCNFN